MKLDKKLFDSKLSPSQINEFKDVVLNTFKTKPMNKFLSFITYGKYSFWIPLGILALGLIIDYAIVYAVKPKGPAFWVGVSFAATAMVIMVVIFLIRFMVRRGSRRFMNKNIDWKELTYGWFKHYGIKRENIGDAPLTPEVRDYIIDSAGFAVSIGGGEISKFYGGCYIIENGIKSSFYHIVIKYNSWLTSDYLPNYLHQICIIQEGFKPKWSKLSFELRKRSTKQLLRNKHESLENVELGEKFNYMYNDELKLRMVFTPYVQEAIIKNWNKKVVYRKHGPKAITIYSKPPRTATPFVANLVVGMAPSPKSVVQDQIDDFKALTKLLAHPYLFDNMYNK